jgi:hypothetical protein
MKRILLLFAALVFASVMRASEAPTNVVDLFRSPENLAIVAQPERVEAYVLRPRQLWLTRDERKRRYKEGPTAVVPTDAAATLSTKLTADTTYVWDKAKACMPIWNARLKFYRGSHSISADFCFGCDMVAFFRNGQGFSGGNFDHGSDAIFEVIRSLFPQDAVVLEIVEMKKRREEEQALIKRMTEEEKKKKANQAPEPTSGLRPAAAHL